MRNNKSLLYGVGTGIISGVLLLQLMNAATGQAESPQATKQTIPPISEMDRLQLKATAAKYYQVFDKETKIVTQVELEQKLKEEKEKQLAAQSPNQTPAKETVKETYIFVSKGLRASEVGDLLVQSGVITERAGFEEYMDKHQLNQKIVDGVHVFKGVVDLPQVVANITAYPR
jgi:hypothetical protein